MIVAERFEVSECVGSGSCGAVFRAWDRVLEREVAIKQLVRGVDEHVMKTSRAAARLNHPAIVPLFEVGENDEGAFMVSEYIDGLTLRQAHLQGRLTDRDVAEIGADLCAALHHAHERGVIHGDIKPENVIVRTKEANPDQRAGRCQAKLRDFATREILAETAEPTGAYLTPEQIDGAEAGPASDVFGVALVLFECWTGRNPMADAATPVIARIRGRHLPSMVELRPDLPKRLTALIDAALDAEPGRRPRALDLREWLDHVFDDLDHELALPEPEPPRAAVFTTRSLVGGAATVTGGCALALVGAAPAAFAISSWPARPLARALLAAATTIAILLLAWQIDASILPIELGEPATPLTPYVPLLLILWASGAVVLGTLARATAPLSGAALGAAFCLLTLIGTEFLALASDSSALGSLLPLVVVAAATAAIAILVSRHAARSVVRSAALQDGPIAPPEPDDSEIRVTAQPASRQPSERFQAVPVP